MAVNGYAGAETLQSALGPPFTLGSSTCMSETQDGDVESNSQATSSRPALLRLASDERGSSPARPALVASLEAKRRASSVASIPAARLFDMGPPSASSNVSPGSFRSPAEGEQLRLQPVGPTMQERESVLSISIICDQGGTRVSLSETASTSAEGVSTTLLLSALEEAKDRILRSQWRDGQPIPQATSPRKRRASESASSSFDTAKRLRQSASPQKGSGDSDRVIEEIPSSDEFLNHLLVSFGKQGYDSMTAEQREALMMSTLSTTFASFATKLQNAQRCLDDQQREAVVCLGQRDEAISRLRDAENRLFRGLDPARPPGQDSAEWQSRKRARADHGSPNDGTKSTYKASSSSKPTSISASTLPATSDHQSTPSPDGLLKITLQPVTREQATDHASDHSSRSGCTPSSEFSSTSQSLRFPLVEYRNIQSTYQHPREPALSPSAGSQIACGLPQAYPLQTSFEGIEDQGASHQHTSTSPASQRSPYAIPHHRFNSLPLHSTTESSGGGGADLRNLSPLLRQQS